MPKSIFSLVTLFSFTFLYMAQAQKPLVWRTGPRADSSELTRVQRLMERSLSVVEQGSVTCM